VLKQRSLFTGIVIVSAWFMQTAVWADTIPQDLLDLDYQRCVNDCVPGFGETTCKPLCTCTVAEFSKRLDFQKYLDLSVELSRNEIKPENRKLLDTIAKYCTSELEKSGVTVGDGQSSEQ